MSKGRYSIRMFLATMLTGFIYFAVAEIFYQRMITEIPGIIVIPLYFTGLFFALGIVVLALGKAINNKTSAKINKKQWVISFLLIIALSVLFEFLYEMIKEGNQTEEIHSYLFVLDDSGSMADNDPERVRYQAIDRLLEDKDGEFQYGIYSFNEDIRILRDMAPKDSVVTYEYPEAYGGTPIYGVLSELTKDMERGELLLDSQSRIILLSDGYATDISMFTRGRLVRILKEVSKKGVSISTVGLSSADDSLMSMIAAKTGGVYVKAEDVSSLEEVMNQAAVSQNTTRDLLGYRTSSFLNWLLGIMRVVFIAVLGVVIAVEKTILAEHFPNTRAVLISSLAGSILAGVCIETGMNLLGIHPTIMRMITCILISFTLLKTDMYSLSEEGSDVKYAGKNNLHKIGK